MGVKWIRGKSFPIGIDLGSYCLKMAQLRVQDDELILSSAGMARLSEEARTEPGQRLQFYLEGIRNLLRRHPFKGKRCVISIPAEATIVQHIKVTKMPPEQLATALQWELQGKLPYDPSCAIIRHVVAGEIMSGDEMKQELIVTAVSREAIESHLEMIHKAKLDCVGVNVEPNAVVDAFARMFRRAEDLNAGTLFLDIGAKTTQVVISHGPQLVFAKNLRIAGDQFDKALAEGMRMSLDQARSMRQDIGGGDEPMANVQSIYNLLKPVLDQLAEEVVNCIRYYESVFHTAPIERAVFLGGQAHDKRLCQLLAQRLSLPAQIGDPLARINRSEGAGMDIGLDRRTVQPDWAVAVGLSIGQAEGVPAAQPVA